MSYLFPIPKMPAPPRMKRVRRHHLVSPVIPQWELDDAITVVLFAGLGGACQGLEEAGCPVHVANNHDDVAIAAHKALHPHTFHIKGSIFDVCPKEATGGRRVKVLWASPDCRDHSVAKGGAPRSARVRSLPWQVCRWAGQTNPVVIFMENVREIRGWGPLHAKRCPETGRVIKLDGSVAAKGERVPVQQQMLVRNPVKAGRSYRAFIRHLEGLGYNVEARDLCCADYGVPTSRRRWFAVARRDGQPIQWPAQTHAPAKVAAGMELLPWRTAAEIIDWSKPIPSIFERKKPLAAATNRRIAAGLVRYVLESPQPFFIPITHSGKRRAHPGDEPLPTLTTAHRGELAVIAPTIMCNNGENIGVAPSISPLPTVTTGNRNYLVAGSLIQTGYGERAGQAPRVLDLQAPLGTQMAGGAKHALVAAWLAQHNTGSVGVDLGEPISTLTTRCTQQQVAATYLTKLRGECVGTAAGEPVPTISAGGNHVAATAAFLTQYYSQGGQDQAADVPLGTVTCKARFNLVTVQVEGQPYVVADIGMRMLEPSEAAAAHELTLPRTINIGGVERILSKTEAMRLVGNSVPKRMARLLAQANQAHALYSTPTEQVAA